MFAACFVGRFSFKTICYTHTPLFCHLFHVSFVAPFTKLFINHRLVSCLSALSASFLHFFLLLSYFGLFSLCLFPTCILHWNFGWEGGRKRGGGNKNEVFFPLSFSLAFFPLKYEGLSFFLVGFWFCCRSFEGLRIRYGQSKARQEGVIKDVIILFGFKIKFMEIEVH